MVEKACTNCNRLIEKGNTCDICKNNELTTNWRGLVVVYDPEQSEIAEKIGVATAGRYAVRVNG